MTNRMLKFPFCAVIRGLQRKISEKHIKILKKKKNFLVIYQNYIMLIELAYSPSQERNIKTSNLYNKFNEFTSVKTIFTSKQVLYIDISSL